MAVLQCLKDIASTVQSFATVGAIILGGIWWRRRRMSWPRAAFGHSVCHRAMDQGRVFLRVTVTVENCGEVLLQAQSAAVWIQQVLPLPDEIANRQAPISDNKQIEAQWPILVERTQHFDGKFEVEPGEKEELHFDFELKDNIQTIQVYSYFQNPTKRHGRGRKEKGWMVTTLYDLHEKKT